jgi:hypothetical protein
MLFKDNSNLIAQNFASYFNQLLNNVPEDDFYLKQQNETSKKEVLLTFFDELFSFYSIKKKKLIRATFWRSAFPNY